MDGSPGLRRSSSSPALWAVVGVVGLLAVVAAVPAVPGALETPYAGTLSPSAVRPMAVGIVLTPTSGPAGTSVTVAGGGWSPVLAVLITIAFAGTNVTTSPSTCSSSSGTFSCSFSAPGGHPGPDNVTATGGGSSAHATFTETGALAVHPNPADVGSNVSVWGGGFGHGLSISSFTLGGQDVNCTAAAVGTCANGSITTDGTGTFNVTILVPTVPSAGLFELNATDSAGKTESANISIYLGPKVTGITASAPSADIGQTVVFTASVLNGSGGFSYYWTGLPGCGGRYDPLTCLVRQAVTTTIRVWVSDSVGLNVTGPGLAYTTYPDPTVGVPTANRSSVDAGQPVSFAASAASGTGQYVAYEWAGLPAGCAGSLPWVNCTPTSAYSGSVTVRVTDSNGRASARSGPLAFVVDAELQVSLPSPNRTSTDVGQWVEFDASASYGSGGYGYSWSGGPCGVPPGPMNATYDCGSPAPGAFNVSVSVSDSNGAVAASAVLAFRVFPDPHVTLTAERDRYDVGQDMAMSATVTGSSGGVRYVWTGAPAGCASTGPYIACAASRAGNYSVEVAVTDSNGGSNLSGVVVLRIAPALAVAIRTSDRTPSVGEVVTLTASVSGGTGPFDLAWELGDGTSSGGTSVTHAYDGAGTVTVSLRANDSVSASATTSIALTVTYPSSVPPSINPGGPESFGELVLLVVLVGLGAAVAGAWGWRRRQRRRRDTAASEAETR